MPSRHLSLRVDEATLRRLTEQSRMLGQSRSELAKTLIEEGLRSEAHPGIVFRPGPAGRRPGLAAGPDVWEIVQVFKGFGARAEDALVRTAEIASLPVDHVRTALGYYAEYPAEIDEWIERNDEEAARAEAAWEREQALLSR